MDYLIKTFSKLGIYFRNDFSYLYPIEYRASETPSKKNCRATFAKMM